MRTNTEPPPLQPQRLLACFQAGADDDHCLNDYANRWARLLNGQLDWHHPPGNEPASIPSHYLTTHQLILLNDDETFNNLRRSHSSPTQEEEDYHPQPALLLVRRPDWPLRKLLLIIRGEATDQLTLAWGTLFARLTGCQVTTLVVVPPDFRMRTPQIAPTLQANTLPGRHIRSALDTFTAHQIEGVVKISYRSPQSQLQQELAAMAYDLVILGSEPPGRVFAWRLDTLLDPLLETPPPALLVTGTAYAAILASDVNEGQA